MNRLSKKISENNLIPVPTFQIKKVMPWRPKWCIQRNTAHGRAETKSVSWLWAYHHLLTLSPVSPPFLTMHTSTLWISWSLVHPACCNSPTTILLIHHVLCQPLPHSLTAQVRISFSNVTIWQTLIVAYNIYKTFYSGEFSVPENYKFLEGSRDILLIFEFCSIRCMLYTLNIYSSWGVPLQDFRLAHSFNPSHLFAQEAYPL